MSYDPFNAIAEIAADIFGIDAGTVTRDLTADQVETWNSLNHLRLITAAEERFGVRLSMAEIAACKNLGDLADAIARRAGAA